MTARLHLHRVRRVWVSRLSPDNSNAVTLEIETEDGNFEVIMFGMGDDAALNFAIGAAAPDAVVTGPNGHDMDFVEYIDFRKTIAAIEGKDG